ncbi:hypothetical protein SCHPADRAFT_572589 [Schizopora paradoxa]|uniref:Uncharacterized protein n=1 Tax=Schizopora paradoxa TaxID=27342 RepID=A0A0H2RBP4_9AGAM|nr:hypothetical protein SCHPADRAFT_572589 [Schizopora paradoxa]
MCERKEAALVYASLTCDVIRGDEFGRIIAAVVRQGEVEKENAKKKEKREKKKKSRNCLISLTPLSSASFRASHPTSGFCIVPDEGARGASRSVLFWELVIDRGCGDARRGCEERRGGSMEVGAWRLDKNEVKTEDTYARFVTPTSGRLVP